jgi:hypothetical protein
MSSLAVLGHVAAGVGDDGSAGCLVSEKVGGLREAGEVVTG